MLGLIQGMLESPVPLKLQQMMLGKELLHATLEMLCFSSFLKAMSKQKSKLLGPPDFQEGQKGPVLV